MEESTAYSLFVDKLAQSFGAIGYHVKSNSEFNNVLKSKRINDIPVIISISINYSLNRILLDDNLIG